jgi:hypothetical protein
MVWNMFQFPATFADGAMFNIACQVPDCPLLLDHVPDMVFPSALIVPV